MVPVARRTGHNRRGCRLRRNLPPETALLRRADCRSGRVTRQATHPRIRRATCTRARRGPRPPRSNPARSPGAGHSARRSTSIRPTYGFEDVSLAPGLKRSIRPTSTCADFAGIPLSIPVLAAAMDAVVDPAFAGALARLGGLAVLNLEGVQTRYEDPSEVLARIATAAGRRGRTMSWPRRTGADPRRPGRATHRGDPCRGSPAAVAATPAAARRFGPFCAEHGADLFLVQSQVSSARHLAVGLRPARARRFHAFHADPGGRRQHDSPRRRSS